MADDPFPVKVSESVVEMSNEALVVREIVFSDSDSSEENERLSENENVMESETVSVPAENVMSCDGEIVKLFCCEKEFEGESVGIPEFVNEFEATIDGDFVREGVGVKVIDFVGVIERPRGEIETERVNDLDLLIDDDFTVVPDVETVSVADFVKETSNEKLSVVEDERVEDWEKVDVFSVKVNCGVGRVSVSDFDSVKELS